MSVLNQLFNRGLLGPKCKTCLNLVISRIKLVQNKRVVQLKQMRQEIAQFLQTGQEAIARIRVEHVIREQNLWAAYEILELFCEFVSARLPIIENQRECPLELREAVASMVFAAPRCSDLPDLIQIKNLFAAKYGKEFVVAVSELRPDSSVNRAMIEKLSASAPSGEVKLQQLKEIAQEYSLVWDSSNTEVQFSKKHEDLLDGSKRIYREHTAVHTGTKKTPSPKNDAGAMPPNSNSKSQVYPANNASILSHVGKETQSKNHNTGLVSGVEKETKPQPSDVLERARAAMASADRASAAARAAAELVDKSFGSWKVDEKSSKS